VEFGVLSMTTAPLSLLCVALSVVAACAPVASEPARAAPAVVTPPRSASTEAPAPDRHPDVRVPATEEPTPAEPEAVPPTAPEAELPAGTTVLHIGDSFAGALGIDLNRELKQSGVRGVLKYETATYIPTWASSKDLPGYLERFRPDLVLITLGANDLEIPDPTVRIPTIHRLVSRLGGRSCVWVAPPLWKGARTALLEVIRESCAPCLYMDSSVVVPDLHRMRDHIHPTMEARKMWAKAVIGWLREHRNAHGERPWDLNP
jgi:lysophospholipase L1-like esterase